MAYLIESVLMILGAALPFTRPHRKKYFYKSNMANSAVAPSHDSLAFNTIRNNKIASSNAKASIKKATAQLALRVAFRLKPEVSY